MASDCHVEPSYFHTAHLWSFEVVKFTELRNKLNWNRTETFKSIKSLQLGGVTNTEQTQENGSLALPYKGEVEA